MKRKGFTLIELLVVISIITLLVSIIIPSLGKARLYAKQVVCSTNLKSIGTAFIMYLDDNKELLPEALNYPTKKIDERADGDDEIILTDVMENYVPKKAWHCPADDQDAYENYGTSYEYLPGLIMSVKDTLAQPPHNIDAQELAMELITEGDADTIAKLYPDLSEETREIFKQPWPLVSDKAAFHPTTSMPNGVQGVFYNSSVVMIDYEEYTALLD